MKYIILFFIVCLTNIAFWADSLQEKIIPKNVTQVSPTWSLDTVLLYARDFIFGILGVVAIGVFLFIGARLLVARGNPDEFKKGLNMFIYAIVWLFVVSAAYAAVRLVAWLNF